MYILSGRNRKDSGMFLTSLTSLTSLDASSSGKGEGTPVPAKDALESMGEFFLVGCIDDKVCMEVSQAILRAAMNVKGTKKPTFNLTISSPGGSWGSGGIVTGVIGRVRREYGVTTNTFVVGEACSMATVLMQQGERRYADGNATFMLHDASYSFFGNDREHSDRRVEHSIVRACLSRAYAQKNSAGHNDPQWWLDNYLDGRDYFLSAEDALVLGLVDEVF